MILLLALACTSDKDPATDSDPPVVDDSEAQTDDSDEPVDTGPFDQDGDGYLAQDDCNDEDIGIHPDANEFCDGIDQDCDGEIDEGAIDATTFYPDADGDGYGTLEGRVESCEEELSGYMWGGTGLWDCDDEDEDVNPGAEEICGNGIDDDCDGEPAEGCRLEGTVSEADAIFRGAAGDLVGHAVTTLDHDGDGEVELAISGWNSDDADGTPVGRVYVATGPFAGEVDLPTESVASFTALASEIGDYDRIGDEVVSGDWDEDGHDDLLISAHLGDFEATSSGAVFLHHGPFTGEIDLTTGSAIYGSAANDGFGNTVRTGFDLTGDTQADLVVGGSGSEEVWIFDRVPQETEGVDIAWASVTSGGSGTELFGRFLDASGDTDGDGVADLAVSAPWSGTDGRAWVVLGPLSGAVVCETDGHAIQSSSGDSGIGYGAVSNSGDLDGDGYDDLLISNYQRGAWVFLGPVDGVRSTVAADATFSSSVLADYFGERGTGFVDDLDLDGHDEVQVAQPQIGGGGPGYVRVWYGPVSGNQGPSDADLVLEGENTGDWFGYEAHPARDVTGNGIPDLLVGGQNHNGGAGATYLFHNTAY